jgi:FKBP-type peptidyl-prolyl cis-trans isomerase
MGYHRRTDSSPLFKFVLPNYSLERMEVRSLLSSVIHVTGRAQSIANGEALPSTGDFTDFRSMSTSPNNALGKITRTFVITDTGDAPLSLLGPHNGVTLSGSNAHDFSLTVSPATIISSGTDSSSFTMTFIPHGLGLRTATVTIHSNDPATPTFSFAIQGTGVRSSNLGQNLGSAVVQAGTGLGAVKGTKLSIDYTGYFTNGIVFDSSVPDPQNPGHAPSQVTLGTGNVIQGWQKGLLGIKARETRILFIPAALAYGAAGKPGSAVAIPPNSPLIFVVTALSDSAPPSLVVSANVNGADQAIALGEKNPSVLDGTLAATDAGYVDPLYFTFKLTNGGGGALISFATRLSGPNSSTFSVTQPTIDNSGNFASFNVIYNPAKVGTQSVVVHVASNDPATPDFIFTVGATFTPFVDLEAIVGTSNSFANKSVIAGGTANYKIPLIVINHGNSPVPASTASIDLQLFLHNPTTNADTLIATPLTTSLRQLAAGKSRMLHLTTSIPADISLGNYQILVKLDQSGVLVDTYTANNVAFSSQIIHVT